MGVCGDERRSTISSRLLLDPHMRCSFEELPANGLSSTGDMEIPVIQEALTVLPLTCSLSFLRLPLKDEVDSLSYWSLTNFDVSDKESLDKLP
ncbi:hypothetical protein AKJ16_DCAP18654 [Drosera capensis]